MTEAEMGRCVYKTRDTKACQWEPGRTQSGFSLEALGGISLDPPELGRNNVRCLSCLASGALPQAPQCLSVP